MKNLLRNVCVYAFALFIASQILTGLKIQGGFPTYMLGGILLTVMMMILRPILSVLALPLNLLTFGAFSSLINAIIIYLLSLTVPQISISPFVFSGASFAGFIIPKISFNYFFAIVACSGVITSVTTFVRWLMSK